MKQEVMSGPQQRHEGDFTSHHIGRGHSGMLPAPGAVGHMGKEATALQGREYEINLPGLVPIKIRHLNEEYVSASVEGGGPGLIIKSKKLLSLHWLEQKKLRDSLAVTIARALYFPVGKRVNKPTLVRMTATLVRRLYEGQNLWHWLMLAGNELERCHSVSLIALLENLWKDPFFKNMIPIEEIDIYGKSVLHQAVRGRVDSCVIGVVFGFLNSCENIDFKSFLDLRTLESAKMQGAKQQGVKQLDARLYSEDGSVINDILKFLNSCENIDFKSSLDLRTLESAKMQGAGLHGADGSVINAILKFLNSCENIDFKSFIKLHFLKSAKRLDETALSLACRVYNWEAAELLLTAGASCGGVDCSGRSPLTKALLSARREVEEYDFLPKKLLSVLRLLAADKEEIEHIKSLYLSGRPQASNLAVNSEELVRRLQFTGEEMKRIQELYLSGGSQVSNLAVNNKDYDAWLEGLKHQKVRELSFLGIGSVEIMMAAIPGFVAIKIDGENVSTLATSSLCNLFSLNKLEAKYQRPIAATIVEALFAGESELKDKMASLLDEISKGWNIWHGLAAAGHKIEEVCNVEQGRLMLEFKELEDLINLKGEGGTVLHAAVRHNNLYFLELFLKFHLKGVVDMEPNFLEEKCKGETALMLAHKLNNHHAVALLKAMEAADVVQPTRGADQPTGIPQENHGNVAHGQHIQVAPHPQELAALMASGAISGPFETVGKQFLVYLIGPYAVPVQHMGYIMEYMQSGPLPQPALVQPNVESSPNLTQGWSAAPTQTEKHNFSSLG
jgi:hypothetical protein